MNGNRRVVPAWMRLGYKVGVALFAVLAAGSALARNWPTAAGLATMAFVQAGLLLTTTGRSPGDAG